MVVVAGADGLCVPVLFLLRSLPFGFVPLLRSVAWNVKCCATATAPAHT